MVFSITNLMPRDIQICTPVASEIGVCFRRVAFRLVWLICVRLLDRIQTRNVRRICICIAQWVCDGTSRIRSGARFSPSVKLGCRRGSIGWSGILVHQPSVGSIWGLSGLPGSGLGFCGRISFQIASNLLKFGFCCILRPRSPGPEPLLQGPINPTWGQLRAFVQGPRTSPVDPL
jgi:hypothetical protein